MGNQSRSIQNFQADEGSYNRMKDIFPISDPAKAPRTEAPQNKETYRVIKDGLGRDTVLRSNLGAEKPHSPSASPSEPAFMASAVRSSSGLFDASRGNQLKKLLDRKRTN